MPIGTGDIQFFKTQVMDDVPEGGGGPTGETVPSGTSNAVLPDVSESDRAIGNVRMRKLVLGVRTDDVSTFLGSNIVLAEPPNDANVDMTIFSTGSMFDRREDAVARLEAYLNIGPAYAGNLYGNHIAGQNTLLLFQKTDTLPAIGSTMVLTKREGFQDELREYVRVTEAASELREFEDSAGKFTRFIVTLKLQNFLSADFGGFDITRFEINQDQLALKTKISDTVVADAARYYGVALLEEDAKVTDFTVKVDSIFSQLVPSAQINTPIADARTNQLNGAPVTSGGTIVQTMTGVFSTTQNLFVGGAVAPNSFSISSGGATLNDTGGKLMNGGQQVGNIDYENGVLSLNSDVFGAGGNTFTVVYSPAATPTSPSQSQGFLITAENRSDSYVRTIEPPPAPGTLTINYMSGGRWYVLREDGSGAIRGSSTAFGAGSLNPASGTVSVTLGALPDVGSSLIFTWVQPEAARPSESITLDNDGKFYWPFNTSGNVSLEAGSKSIQPGNLTVTWQEPASPTPITRTATDNGTGQIVGDASGTVNYARGTMRITPNVLPPVGTTMQVNVSTSTKSTAVVPVASFIGNLGATNITPGSVSFTFEGFIDWQYLDGPTATHHFSNFLVIDDGLGGLVARLGDVSMPAGSINYAAGTFTLLNGIQLPDAAMRAILAYDNVYLARQGTNMTWYNISS